MGRRKGEDIHGWVVLDKPHDVTSTEAVSKVRRLFNARKAGHAGTLDPLATGLLPIALGEATKTVPVVQEGDKTYRFTVRWGVTTDTLDTEGKVTARSDVRPDQAAVESLLPRFTGDIEQVPPKFSAIKVDGERAYDLARDGVDVELKARPVRIARLEIVDMPSADETVFEMDCGKGTYVRSLARDMAVELGTEGHISQLRRTRVGGFTENAAISLDELANLAHKGRAFEGLAPVETALDDIPALAVTEDEATQIRQGRAIVLLPRIAQELRALRRPRDISGKDGSRMAVAMCGEMAVALGEAQAGKFQPSRVFNHNA